MTPEERAAKLVDFYANYLGVVYRAGSAAFMCEVIAAEIREAVDAETEACGHLADRGICRCEHLTNGPDLNDLARHDRDCAWVIAGEIWHRAASRSETPVTR